MLLMRVHQWLTLRQPLMRRVKPAAASPSGQAAPSAAAPKSAGIQEAGHSSDHEPLSPTFTVGSNATASQQSMTSLEVAALNDSDEREPGTRRGHGSEAEVQQPIAGVQPGTEGLGDVATFEVRACSCSIWACSYFRQYSDV